MGAGCRAAGQLRLSHAVRAIFVAIDERILRNADLARLIIIYSALQCSHCKCNARIASAVLAIAFLSVHPSVRLSVTCRYCVKTTARSTVQFALSDSKMNLVL